ncbi:MAG: hypothetical protein HC771_20395 [Synechococcales cyanobacterium CRU_2_2]|nr:hypothetical protein [Synechococcales cyanobacterium CRU_2_2]
MRWSDIWNGAGGYRRERFRRVLDAGRSLVLLDGLDEVMGAHGQVIANSINEVLLEIILEVSKNIVLC